MIILRLHFGVFYLKPLAVGLGILNLLLAMIKRTANNSVSPCKGTSVDGHNTGAGPQYTSVFLEILTDWEAQLKVANVYIIMTNIRSLLLLSQRSTTHAY